MHAELTLGGGMVMLGSVNDATPGRRMRQPGELEGANTRGVSLIVDDADAVHGLAVAEGAVIVEPLEDKPFGGRGFACLDPEGHIWHVVTYSPWAAR